MNATHRRRPGSRGRGRRRGFGTVLATVLLLATAACSGASARWQPDPPAGTSAPASGIQASAEENCVAATMAKMTLDRIAGQVMLVGTPLGHIASVDKVIRTYHIGGVFLGGRSHASAASLRASIAGLQKAAPPGVRLFVSLDQEGGEVQSLQGPDFPAIPTAQTAGRQSAAALKAQTTGWAKRLAAIGVNLDLAPVADTVPASLGVRNPPIGGYHRQYGSDPAAVAADIAVVVPAIQSTGVVTTLKHFPGLGRTLVNTDFSAKAVDATATTHDTYLQPFVAGIKAGTGAVMISSASYPKLDPHSIATFSKPIVTGLLRTRLGFTGMIVSDSLAGAAAIASVPVAQRAVRFVQAGGDLVLTTSASKAPMMIKGLIAAAHASAAFTTQLTAAATAVVRAKYATGLLSCSPPAP
jgi:beta-N-acetylhexosaminidase